MKRNDSPEPNCRCIGSDFLHHRLQPNFTCADAQPDFTAFSGIDCGL